MIKKHSYRFLNKNFYKKMEKKKDIEIRVIETKSVESVNYEALYNSLKGYIRTIKILDLEYENDEDFGTKSIIHDWVWLFISKQLSWKMK